MSLDTFDANAATVSQIKRSIESAIAGADVAVKAASAGHFEIDVTSDAFTGKSMVQQQQLVYAAIKELMAGDAAPVHAIDRLRTKTP